jgi:hypothetical protein
MYGQNLFILYLFYIMAAEKKVQATAGKDT